ncbi:hypothetical protein BT96DRAFT_956274 [Gymnopus androsaceus JB14]|uniref:Uncharacterized protein n=1 Tax=Gymnopus androsaceus JB14 TaxID=1447944 RepID=A0A6A4HT82_9AGAR|nr:hypothetical protein BT96DRAFT_956274 [Gymnopus androsaceus JB14]
MSRKLAVHEGLLDDHKQFVLAIADGRFKRVDRLIQAGLKAGMGIHGLLNLYERAAEGLYHLKGYEEKDNLHAILFWHLGATPTLIEIFQNFEACFKTLTNILGASVNIVHAVLMFDEIATKKQPQHVAKTCIKFENENDLKMMMDDIQTGDVHLASEATVGAVGILSGDSRIYSAHPILISGTCKKKRVHAHADLIQCTIDSVHHKSADMNLPLCLFMNLYVGDDNLTADKDWKHVTIEHLRNLILCDQGIMIDGFLITPSVARAHLSDAGHSSVHLQSVFEPEDKQDVTLAYSLLSDIWSLSEIPEKSTPAFIFGKLCYHLIYLYICIDLSLTEQLNHLSTAAHLAFALHFLPNQLYIDIMIMVKNKYFFGSDRNLDLLQAAECLTGTTEVSNILALHPDWDKSPYMTQVEDQVDHIKPQAWQGDLCVANVSLLSSWKTGCRMIEQEVPLTLQVLAKLDVCEGCDILQPKGVLLVHAPLDANDIADLDDSLNLDSVPHQIDSAAQGQTTPGLQAFKDMVAGAAMPPEKVERTVSIDGSILSKSHALALAFKHLGSASSADHLKQQLMQVLFQLLSLLPATSEDDRTLKNDWCTGASLLYTFKVPGTLVVPVNPKLSMAIPTHPAYLFESLELLALTSLLLEKVTQLDLKGVPSISRTNDFPYLE